MRLGPECVDVERNVWRHRLPLRREVLLVRQRGVRTVIDLSDRHRQTVARACADLGLRYEKIPIDEQRPSASALRSAVDLAKRGNCLVHCYRGIHRTGVVIALVRMAFGTPFDVAVSDMLSRRFGRRHDRLITAMEALC